MKANYLYPIIFFIGVVLYGCSGGGTSSNQTAAPQSSNVTGGSEGQNLFEAKCAVCHGSDGKAGIGNAADLNISRLDSAAVEQIIVNGKNTMPSFGRHLSEEELHKLAGYVLTLRQ